MPYHFIYGGRGLQKKFHMKYQVTRGHSLVMWEPVLPLFRLWLPLLSVMAPQKGLVPPLLTKINFLIHPKSKRNCKGWGEGALARVLNGRGNQKAL